MSKLKRLGFILFAVLMAFLVFWLSANQVNYFSFPMYFWRGHPQDWIYIVLNIIFLSLFILFIKFRRRATRLPASIYLAFIVALFVEMYGFTLTLYVVTWIFGFSGPGADNLWYLVPVATGSDWLFILLYILSPISNVIIAIGMLLIIFGWRKIYRAKGKFVTTGIYAKIRHPQYLGFLLITLGMNVLWVTIITFILWPILVVLYYRLAKEEDKRNEEAFGEEYRKYERTVPMFIPHLSSKKLNTQRIAKKTK